MIEFITLYDIFYNNPKFWTNLGWWIQIIGGSGTFVTLFVFWLQLRYDRKKKKKDELQRIHKSCNAILKEIDDHKNAFNNLEPSEHFRDIQGIKYGNRVLNTNVYDSILHSGLFTHFESKTQNSLSNLYNRINQRNKMLDYLHRYRDIFFFYDNSIYRERLWIKKERIYAKDINILENEIKDLIERVEILIKTELP
ncbi:MAG: hypothetical protein H0X03_07930 [Nitrosopumilus sp.]|nr:hypothetical protein [Nitrosopumilus sp.]